jgi:hypothetical protein
LSLIAQVFWQAVQEKSLGLLTNKD